MTAGAKTQFLGSQPSTTTPHLQSSLGTSGSHEEKSGLLEVKDGAERPDFFCGKSDQAEFL
jgi:hypothetical protein